MSMKLVCTIGTQGLSDGRRIHRGEVYEVDDETASTALASGYATKYVEPVVAEPEVVKVPDAPEEMDVAEEPEMEEEMAAPEKPNKVTRKKIGGR